MGIFLQMCTCNLWEAIMWTAAVTSHNLYLKLVNNFLEQCEQLVISQNCLKYMIQRGKCNSSHFLFYGWNFFFERCYRVFSPLTIIKGKNKIRNLQIWQNLWGKSPLTWATDNNNAILNFFVLSVIYYFQERQSARESQNRR